MHEPLAGGTPGATVAVEPIVDRAVHLPRTMDGTPGRSLRRPQDPARRCSPASDAVVVPVPPFSSATRAPGRSWSTPGFTPRRDRRRRRTSAVSPAASASRTLTPGEDVPAQLRERGLDPGEIPVVVMTHMHLDHTLGDLRVPELDLHRQRNRVGGRDDRRRTAAEWLPPHAHYDYAFDYRTVDFDRGGIDSYATFGRTFDLFGDGSIRLAFTPGPQRRPHVGDRPSRGARLRDRRRRHLHAGPARRQRAPFRPGPSTPITTGARCRS